MIRCEQGLYKSTFAIDFLSHALKNIPDAMQGLAGDFRIPGLLGNAFGIYMTSALGFCHQKHLLFASWSPFFLTADLDLEVLFLRSSHNLYKTECRSRLFLISSGK